MSHRFVSSKSYIGSRGIALEVRLDGLVLLVKVSQVGDEVLDNIGVGQRVNLDVGRGFSGNSAFSYVSNAHCQGQELVHVGHTQASERVLAVDVHGTATADTFTAASSEGESRVQFVLDADDGVQHHRAGLVQIDGVALHVRLFARGIRVPSVDLECLHARLFRRRFFSHGRHGSSEDCSGAGSRPEGRAKNSRRGRSKSGHFCGCSIASIWVGMCEYIV